MFIVCSLSLVIRRFYDYFFPNKTRLLVFSHSLFFFFLNFFEWLSYTLFVVSLRYRSQVKYLLLFHCSLVASSWPVPRRVANTWPSHCEKKGSSTLPFKWPYRRALYNIVAAIMLQRLSLIQSYTRMYNVYNYCYLHTIKTKNEVSSLSHYIIMLWLISAINRVIYFYYYHMHVAHAFTISHQKPSVVMCTLFTRFFFNPLE